jgi:hypothetical protein
MTGSAPIRTGLCPPFWEIKDVCGARPFQLRIRTLRNGSAVASFVARVGQGSATPWRLSSISSPRSVLSLYAQHHIGKPDEG